MRQSRVKSAEIVAYGCAQIDLVPGGSAFALSVCAMEAHRNARAITPTAISTAANATVNASIKSVCMIDLYIVSHCIGRIPEARLCRETRLHRGSKSRSFRNLRRRTDGKFVIVTIARAITNCSSRKFKELGNSHSHCVESDWNSVPPPLSSAALLCLNGRPNARPACSAASVGRSLNAGGPPRAPPGNRGFFFGLLRCSPQMIPQAPR